MKIYKRVTSLALAAILTVASLPAYAAKTMTMEEVVKHGIENSRALDEVEVEIDLSQVSKDRGRYSARKLRRGNKDIKDGISALNTAQSLIDKGIAPEDINLPDGTVIEAGTDINKLPIPDEYKQGIKNEVNKGIESGREQLDRGDYAIAQALDQAGATIGSALDFASLNALTIDSSADLIELMPDVAHEVTQASFDIYKNSIALLIKKNYYDVLGAEELLKVRKAAMDRGKKQYEFAKASYNEGMKPKDDMLMAEVYYKATKLAYEQTKSDIETNKIELKKNAGLKMDEDIKLVSDLSTEPENFDLNEGLKQGMENRLEIKKSLGEVLIFSTNFKEVKSSFTENTFQYREAKLLNEKAGIKYEQAKDEVESSIRKSYALMKNTRDLLYETEGMVENAKENVKIAEARYKEGFGVDTSMLSSLNLEASAGTILEVIAAEEKLAEIEENIVKITHGYNLARLQYRNNIGDFDY